MNGMWPVAGELIKCGPVREPTGLKMPYDDMRVETWKEASETKERA